MIIALNDRKIKQQFFMFIDGRKKKANGTKSTRRTENEKMCHRKNCSFRWFSIQFINISRGGKFAFLCLWKSFSDEFSRRDGTERRWSCAELSDSESQLLNLSIQTKLFVSSTLGIYGVKFEHNILTLNFHTQHIVTIGDQIDWNALSPNEPLPPDFIYRLPADLKHAVSYVTMKVLEGESIPMVRVTCTESTENDLVEEASLTSDSSEECRRLLERPMVKKDVHLEAQRRSEKPSLDISLPHVCFWCVCDL